MRLHMDVYVQIRVGGWLVFLFSLCLNVWDWPGSLVLGDRVLI